MRGLGQSPELFTHHISHMIGAASGIGAKHNFITIKFFVEKFIDINFGFFLQSGYVSGLSPELLYFTVNDLYDFRISE